MTAYLVAAVAVMGGAAYKQRTISESYRAYIEAGWQRSFNSLTSCMSEIDTALQKTVHSTSPSLMGSACAEIYAKSLEAQASLSELPLSDYQLENMSGFIGKVGDYARAVASGAYNTEKKFDGYDSLAQLSQSASIMAQNLIQMRADMDEGLLSAAQWRQTMEGGFSSGMGQSFQYMEDEFPELPTLIYDGPYSQHIDEGAAKLIEGTGEVSQEEALKIAADFAGLPQNVFNFTGRCESKLPTYCFSANHDGGELSVSVTVQGGRVLHMVSSSYAGAATLSDEQAVKAAQAFLDERGFGPVKESYRTKNGGLMLINFAAVQDGVICYPDLIKVSVALDDGSIKGFEATGYIMNHRIRDIPAGIPDDEARLQVSQRLDELSHEMAIIPTEGKNEVFCHEFKCVNSDGRHYIVYINAQTGNEEKILMLIEDENGTLAV